MLLRDKLGDAAAAEQHQICYECCPSHEIHCCHIIGYIPIVERFLSRCAFLFRKYHFFRQKITPRYVKMKILPLHFNVYIY